MKKLFIALLLAGLCVFLTGCFLLPAEEELPRLPLVTEFVGRDMNYTTVHKGDLTLSAKLSIRFMPAEKEDLKFGAAEGTVGGIYFALGDEVKKGDLVAEIEDSELLADIHSAEESLASYMSDYGYYSENIAIAESSPELFYKAESYRAMLALARDNVYVTELRLEALLKKLESNRLYAGMDGTITYINSNSKISRGMTIATITDTASGILYSDTPYADSFKPDTEAYILINGSYYNAVSVSAENAGAQPLNNRVYFALLGDASQLPAEGAGEIEFVLDSRENVLFLPPRAVIETDGEHAVYYRDESGFLSLKPVTIGLETPQGIEITGGLDEGEEVVLG